ncbi:unnamed protein product, partial [Laminaria digitata]
ISNRIAFWLEKTLAGLLKGVWRSTLLCSPEDLGHFLHLISGAVCHVWADLLNCFLSFLFFSCFVLFCLVCFVFFDLEDPCAILCNCLLRVVSRTVLSKKGRGRKERGRRT